MRTANRGRLLRSISTAYGDLENPSYSFIDKVLRKAPYRELTKLLSDNFVLEDMTDLDEDVAFRLLLATENGRSFMVELSFIGPYFVVFEVSDRMVHFPTDALSIDPEISQLHSILVRFGLTPVSAEILGLPIPMRSLDIDRNTGTFYDALFSTYGSITHETAVE